MAASNRRLRAFTSIALAALAIGQLVGLLVIEDGGSKPRLHSEVAAPVPPEARTPRAGDAASPAGPAALPETVRVRSGDDQGRQIPTITATTAASARPPDGLTAGRRSTANFETGAFNAFVNYSCKVGGGCKSAFPLLLNPGVGTACGTPESPPTVRGCVNATMDASSPNTMFVTPFGRGIKVSYTLKNAAVPSWQPAPTIDGSITIEPLPSSNRVRVCASGDDYPSLEVYHDLGGTTVPVLQLKESSAGPGALFAAWPNRHECQEG